MRFLVVHDFLQDLNHLVLYCDLNYLHYHYHHRHWMIHELYHHDCYYDYGHLYHYYDCVNGQVSIVQHYCYVNVMLLVDLNVYDWDCDYDLVMYDYVNDLNLYDNFLHDLVVEHYNKIVHYYVGSLLHFLPVNYYFYQLIYLPKLLFINLQ